MKFTISLLPIDKVFLFEESISVVADRAGWAWSWINNKDATKIFDEIVGFKNAFFKILLVLIYYKFPDITKKLLKFLNENF